MDGVRASRPLPHGDTKVNHDGTLPHPAGKSTVQSRDRKTVMRNLVALPLSAALPVALRKRPRSVQTLQFPLEHSLL